MKQFYPEKPAIDLGQYTGFTRWDRYQLVIPCFDKEQADRISAKVAEFCGHAHEHLACFTRSEDGGPHEILEETVIERRSVGISLAIPEDAALSPEEVEA